MKLNRQSLLAFTLSLLVLSACSKKSSNLDPIPLEDHQNIVLVPTDKLTALDGSTGMVKWEMPFLGGVSAGSGKLYLNQTSYDRIGMYSDTVDIYNNPSKTKNLITVEPSTGKVIHQVYNQLKPGFYLGCCHELQVNQLIGVDNSTAFMALVFRGPFSNGWPEIERFAIYATDLTTGSVKWTTDIATSEIPAFDSGEHMMRLTDNKIYIGGTKFSYILDAETGKKIQGYPIGDLVNSINGTFYAMNNEKILAVDSKSGTVRWELQKNNTTAYTYPVVDDGSCFFGTSSGKLYGYDAVTGKKKWERQFGDHNQGGFHQLAAENGVLFASYMNGKMFAIDQSTGNTQWESQMYNADDIFPWNFEVKSNFIYAWAYDKVVALDKETGLKKWEKAMGKSFYSKPRVFDDTQLDL